MVIKRQTNWVLSWLILFLLLPLSWVSHSDQETLGDLGALQQDSRWLKATIEHLRLQQELTTLRPFSGTTQKICLPGDSLGNLVLHSIYQKNQHYYATFSYSPHSQLTVRRGQPLLCGETVLQITLDGVEVQKQGRRYRLSGQIATLLTPTNVASTPVNSQGAKPHE